MKRLLLGLALLLTISASAHTFTQSCWNLGRVKYHCTGMERAGTVSFTVHIITPGVLWGNGTQDSTFNFTSGVFDLYIPQPLANSYTTWSIANKNAGNQTIEIHLLTVTPCGGTLALKINMDKAEWINDTDVKVRITILANTGNSKMAFLLSKKDNSIIYPKLVINVSDGTAPGVYEIIIRLENGSWKRI